MAVEACRILKEGRADNAATIKTLNGLRTGSVKTVSPDLVDGVVKLEDVYDAADSAVSGPGSKAFYDLKMALSKLVGILLGVEEAAATSDSARAIEQVRRPDYLQSEKIVLAFCG